MYVQQSDINHYNGQGFKGKQAYRDREAPPEPLVALGREALKYCVAFIRSKHDVSEKDILSDISG